MSKWTIGLALLRDKYNIKKESVLARLGGAGDRTLPRRRSRRWERFRAVMGKPGRGSPLSLEFWLSRGSPLNPYLKGLIVDYIRQE